MKILVLLIAASLLTLPAHAQGQADPRAVESCKNEATFVAVKDCIPKAHVGFVVQDAFDRLYSGEAAVLKAGCIERNEKVDAVGTCLVSAVRDAVMLAAMLPLGTTLNDPVFDSVKSEDALAQLNQSIDAARSVFPGISYWGGDTYYPYQ